ncbi:MAG: single-stranded DNA-binding protein [Fibrobacter sp.]|nr:single-stranded DNA-binding protein [Fibrobacter sp.]
MASVNKAILIGNLGRDPEFKYTPGGQPVATFTLATTERFADKSGQKQERTEWHNVVAWGKLAELCNQYLKKGRSVYIEGRITTRSWDDKDNVKRYKTEIVANTLQFIGGGNQSSQGGGGAPDPEYSQSFPSYDMPSGPSGSSGVVEDDLPF